MAVEELALDTVDGVLILGQIGQKAGERNHMRRLATCSGERLAQVAVGYRGLSGSVGGDRVEVFRPMRMLMMTGAQVTPEINTSLPASTLIAGTNRELMPGS